MTTAFRVGSLAQDAVTGIKHLFARVAANKYSTFEFPSGTDYPVTAGKIFYITRIRFTHTAAGDNCHLGYADDGVQDAVAGGTNSVIISKTYFALVAKVEYEWDVFIPVPAGKFVQVYVDNPTGTLEIEGVEL